MGFAIEPNRIYTEYELRVAGVFDEETLRRARKSGLRCKEPKRGYRLYRGRWLIEWMERKEEVAP